MKQNKLTQLVITIILILTIADPVFSGVDGDLHKFFDDLGMESNVTSPQAYKGQQAGYYTGGSIVARSKATNVNIANIKLPSLSTGCGGIDLFMGGFSFIDNQKLVETLKNILNSAKSYAFNLALESVTPEIANTMKHISDQLNKVNQFNINSCETSAALVGSIWPRTVQAQRQVCADIGLNKNDFTDYAAARQGCGPGGEMSNKLNEGKGGEFKDFIINNSNIAWKALHSTGSTFQGDTQLAEFLMSLSGTVIITSQNGGKDNKKSVLPSLADKSDLVAALLYGTDDKTGAKIYQCDEKDDCLNPHEANVSISQNEALSNRVRSILKSISNKIRDDEPLSDSEKGLLEATSLPIYKILNVQSAYFKGADQLNISSYADVIAIDILFQYLQKSLMI